MSLLETFDVLQYQNQILTLPHSLLNVDVLSFSFLIFLDWFLSFDTAEQDDRNLEDWETLVWDGNKAPPDQQIDQFMILARQVITHSNSTNTDTDKML